MDEFEELEEFISCYFHQDWKMEADTDEEAVKLYLAEFHDDLVGQCLQEFDQVLKQVNDGILDVEKVLTRFGCAYAYEYFGYTGLEWLERLKSLILKYRGEIKFVPVLEPATVSSEPDET